MIVEIPVSVGELVDKITILEIKLKKFKGTDKFSNVEKEYNLLKHILDDLDLYNIIVPLYNKLHEINLELWSVEDRKREMEKLQSFDNEFIELARQVYLKNDERALIKKQINLTTGSGIIEEKSHF